MYTPPPAAPPAQNAPPAPSSAAKGPSRSGALKDPLGDRMKRYVGTATHTAVQPIAQPDGNSVYVPVQYTSAVYECQDRNGRFIDVEAP